MKQTKQSTPAPPGVHPVYLRLLASHLDRRGFAAGSVLVATGLPAQAAGADEAPVSVAALQRALAMAERLSGSPWLGLEFGASVQAFSHGPLGLAAAASGSLRQALEVACRFIALRAPVLRLDLTEEADALRLRIGEAVELGSARRFVAEALLVMLERLLQAASARAFDAVEYALPWPEPAWSRHYAAFLAGRPVFSAAGLELRIPRTLADAPCLSADPDAFAFARAECERRLAQDADGRDLLARVRRRLWACETDWPDATAMASALGLSLRGFHRALAASGLGYRAVLDEVRFERAARLLRETALPVESIALRLGYADASNFSRCFRRWSGQAPGRFRQGKADA